MILFELCNEQENHHVYQALEVSNGLRQYDFLRSIVGASIEISRPFISTQVIKALNFHAIACLHTNAGEFRPCEVQVGNHYPPQHFRVEALMNDLVNWVNRYWDQVDAVVLAAYVLWRLNYIHPFINGNGRTARAVSYFILCLKSDGWLPGSTILPELIKKNRDRYVVALEHADNTNAAGALDIEPLHLLLVELLNEQMAVAQSGPPQDPTPEG